MMMDVMEISLLQPVELLVPIEPLSFETDVIATTKAPAPIEKENIVSNIASNIVSDTSMGCYLTFDIANEGSLFLNWSEKYVEGSLAFFAPRKQIPKFKFKQNGGKSEFLRGLRGGVGIKKYFEGWTQFIKLAKDFNSNVTLFCCDDVALYYTNKDSKVMQIKQQQTVDSNDLYVICAVGPGDSSFDGICSIDRNQFTGTGNRQGSALPL